MAISSYPSGFRGGVLLKEVPLFDMIAGNVYWVDSGAGGAGNPGTFNRPLSTVDGAIGKCTASNGDFIFVKPGHAETVTASSIALDVAGVSVVCLGNAENQAVFTYGAAAATITVSAANCTWAGGIHQANFLDVASAFTLGAAKGFTLRDAKFEDTTASLNFLSIVTTGATDNDADDMTVANCSWYGLNTTPLAFVSILAAELRPTISGCSVNSASTADVGHFVTLAAKIVLGARFVDNELIVVGSAGATVGIFLTGSGTTNTGIVARNLVASLDTTTELIATAGTGLKFFENYYTGVADASGKLWPAVDAA
jgi:hypothetical protein